MVRPAGHTPLPSEKRQTKTSVEVNQSSSLAAGTRPGRSDDALMLSVDDEFAPLLPSLGSVFVRCPLPRLPSLYTTAHSPAPSPPRGPTPDDSRAFGRAR